MSRPSSSLAHRLAALGLLVGVCSCDLAGVIDLPPLPPGPDAGPARFICKKASDTACEDNAYVSCKVVGEFLQVQRRDCTPAGQVCNLARGCIACVPTTMRCTPCTGDDPTCNKDVVQRCNDDGTDWEDVKTCDEAAGDTCNEGDCRNMCQLANDQRSYVGCEFWPVDLDNAAIDNLNDASHQQFAVAMANPQSVPVDVRVEINDGAFGDALQARAIDMVTVPPGALEVFKLPRREVDGSSELGLNDGTNTAVSSNAFRLSSSHPIVAYQFNPLENVNVFSNGASLLLPVSAIGVKYTVNGWPQTIANSDNPDQDFDPTVTNEDLRAFLTIVGVSASTNVHIALGDKVVKVVGAGPIPESGPGDQLDIRIGPYDVVNLETQGFNADFTGSTVESDQPVTLYVGSEASDVPIFSTYATRQCCADHLESQLLPDRSLGTFYSVARTPNRTKALAEAAFPDDPLGVSVIDYPEWVRVIAVAPGITTVTTTMPAPDDQFHLRQGEDAILEADQDLILHADQPVSVLQALPSQAVTGIPRQYPGGDPDIFPVPPVEQYRKDYIFLTPDKYAFDFVTIMADAATTVLLDGAPLPDTCEKAAADGIVRQPGEAPPDRVVYRCQLSFPKVTSGADSRVLAGDQHDGVHTIVADREVGIVVNGFDRFVSYAYVGGLNLQLLN
ncbi:MAG: IgGFc-binding protein [Polyangiales bacterium]